MLKKPTHPKKEVTDYKIKFVFWGLVTLVVIMPAALGGNRPLPWSIMSLTTGILLLIWGISAHQKHNIYGVSLRHIKFIALPFVIAMVWIILQAFLSGGSGFVHPIWLMTERVLQKDIYASVTLDSYKTIEGFMKFLTYGMVFWLSLQLGRSSSNAKKMLFAIAIAGGIYALYGIILQLTESETILWLNERLYSDSVSSTFINRNSYATYAGIGIIVSMALFFTALFKDVRKSNHRQFYFTLINNFTKKAVIFLVIVILLIAALIMTHSRAGIACVSIGCISFVGMLTLTKSAKGHRFITAIFTAFLMLTFILALSVGGNVVSKRFSVLDQEITMRGDIYATTLNAIKDFPVLGSGLGTFENIFSMYRDTRFPKWLSLRMDHAHNTYLETMLELGIPAFLLLAVSIISILTICFKGLITRQRNAIFPAIALAVSIVIWLHALFDFSIEMPAIAITYAAILGIGCAQSWSSTQSMSDKPEQNDE